jgi:membrane-bound metal-dependent hydrolase YbcI (DUF457 family)
MIPDIEIPFIVLIFGVNGSNRLILHSLLGSATLGIMLAVIVTMQFYPFLVSSLFRVDKEKVESKCKFSFALVLSAFVGTISHVLLDFTNHLYNPLFWPFLGAEMTVSPIFEILGEQFAYFWIQVIMGILLLVIILVERKDIAERLLVG